MPDEHVSAGLRRDAALVAAAGMGAVAGITAGGPAALFIAGATTQASVAVVGRAWDTLSAARRQRATIPFQHAALLTGTSIDELTEVLVDHPERAKIVTAVIQTAMDTGLDAKLLELGRILAATLEDDAQLDLDWLTVDALSVVEAPHLKVLAKLGSIPRGIQSDWFPELGIGLTPIILGLAGKGLIREEIEYREQTSPGQFPGVSAPRRRQVTYHRWQTTDFGSEVFVRLKRAADELAQSSTGTAEGPG